MEGPSPSLPSNYVTIQELKERWLQQQHQAPAKSNPHHHNHAPQLNPDPSDESAPKRLPRRRLDRRRVIKPQVAVDDSDSGLKPQIDVARNHPKGDKGKKEHSNSKLPNKKNSRRGRKPRVTDENPNGNGTPLLGPEAMVDKIRTQQLGAGRSRSQNGVRKPEDEVPPVTHNDARGHGGVDDDVTNVSKGRNRRRGSERPQVKPKPRPWKPPSEVRRGQTSLVWVKKGESVAN